MEKNPQSADAVLLTAMGRLVNPIFGDGILNAIKVE